MENNYSQRQRVGHLLRAQVGRGVTLDHWSVFSTLVNIDDHLDFMQIENSIQWLKQCVGPEVGSWDIKKAPQLQRGDLNMRQFCILGLGWMYRETYDTLGFHSYVKTRQIKFLDDQHAVLFTLKWL